MKNLTPQLRITVNSRCQKACFFCRPAGEASVQFPEFEMSNEEIIQISSRMAAHGITDIKLTGGDPILKTDIVALVSNLKKIPGIESVHLVTRHQKAGQLAHALADAGLDCLNFSLDTLKPEKFKKITGVNGLPALLKAIEDSVPVSNSVKINTVVMAGINEDELFDLIHFSEKVGVSIIKFLDLILDMEIESDSVSFAHRIEQIAAGRKLNDLYYPLDDFASQLQKISVRKNIETQPGGLGHPMMTFYQASGLVVQVKDARRGAWYGDICNGCRMYPCHDAIMALRLTSEGKLQRCLARDDNLIDLWSKFHVDEEASDKMIKLALETYKTASYLEKPPTLAQKQFHLE